MTRDNTEVTALFIRTTKSRDLSQVAALDNVLVINPDPEQGFLIDMAQQVIDAESSTLLMNNGTVYDGTGEKICVLDSGFDTGESWADEHAVPRRATK